MAGHRAFGTPRRPELLDAITAAVVQGGQLIATSIVDTQEVPSAIVAGGIFLSRVQNRLPDFFY